MHKLEEIIHGIGEDQVNELVVRQNDKKKAD